MELVNGYFGEVSGPTIESFCFLAQGTTTVAQLRQLGCPDVNTQEFLETLRTQLVYNVGVACRIVALTAQKLAAIYRMRPL